MISNSRLLFVGSLAVVTMLLVAGCATNNSTSNNGSTAIDLKICTMNPLTGGLNNLGQSMQNAMHMAVDEINAANAGIKVTVTSDQDDKTSDSAAAPTTFNLCVTQGAQAVTGPCCSGVTGAILDKAKESQVVVISPSATSPALTEKDNKGYFWRVSPTDAGQGVALAQLVKNESSSKVNLVIVNNAYGNGLASVFQSYFTTTLSGVVVNTIKFDESATDFSSQITQACAGAGVAVDGVVFVAYTEQVAAIIKGMQTQACLGGKVKLFASEGAYTSGSDNVASKAGKDANGKFLAVGMKGTTPQANNNTAWYERYVAKFNKQPQQYSPEAYDSVMYAALASLSAKSGKASEFKAKFPEIVNTPGDKCTTFRDCAALIKDGKDIDYVGIAHNLDFSSKDEPKVGEYAYWTIQDDGIEHITTEHVLPPAQ